MKRPLMPVALLFMAGILMPWLVSVSPFIILSSGVLLAMLTLLWGGGRPILVWPLVFLTGWTDIALRTAIISPHDLRRILSDQPELVSLHGALNETPTLRVFQQNEKEVWHTQARINVSALRFDRGAWQPAVGRVAVTTPELLTNFFGGQTVEISGVVRRPNIAVAEGTFDYRAYLSQQGIYYQLETESEQDWEIISSPGTAPLADRFRAWARKALALGLPEEDEALRLEWALTLGWKPALTEETSEPFIRAATYHIFAVDGLRMAIVFGIFFGLFRAVGIPRAVCGLVLVPWIWFYAALTGWPASAIRATVMLTVIIFGWVLKRPSDLVNSLFTAALIILIWEPRELIQAGFQLSFLVVLCLMLILPILQKLWERIAAPDPLLPERLWPRWQRLLRQPVAYVMNMAFVSLAAWIAGLPLVAYYFNILTPVSTPANLLAVPLCGLVLVSNMASLLLAGWFPELAVVFNHAGWFFMECIRVTSQWFADWHWAYFYVPAPGLLTCALYYGLLIAAASGWLLRPRWRSWKMAGLALSLGLWSWQCWEYRAATRLHILPVHGGIATYFDGPGAKDDLLIDCGTTNSVARITKPFLRAQGVNNLPRLALTHGDIHHVGGASITVSLFNAGHVCISPVRARSPAYRRLVQQFTQMPDKLVTISRNDRLGPWTVLHPQPGDHFPQADDNTLVLYGTFSEARVLLLSDLGLPGQEALMERTPGLRADIVVTGLPTRGEAVGDALLDALQPRLIIVADSEFPVSEWASDRLRERLARRAVPVIYTRSAGAATLEFHGKGWELRTMSGVNMTSARLALQTAPRSNPDH